MTAKLRLFKLVLFHARIGLGVRSLIFLVVMLLLSGFIFWSMPYLGTDGSAIFAPVTLSMVDQDDSLLSRKLIEQLGRMSLVEQVFTEPLADGLARLERNEALLVLVIPEDFYEISMRNEIRPPITVHLNPRQPVEAALFVRMLDNLAASIEGMQASYFAFASQMRPLYDDTGAFIRQMDQAASHVAFQVLGRRSVVEIDESGKFNTVYHVISNLVCLLALQTCLLLVTQIQHERTTGIRDRLILAGAGPWQLLAARQLVGLFWLAAGCLPLLSGLYRAFPAADHLTITVTVLALYWIFALVCQAVANWARPGDGVILGVWLTILAMLLAGGSIYPAPLLPEILREAGKITPAYWAARTLYRALEGQAVQPQAVWAAAAMAVPATLAAYASYRSRQAVIRPGDLS